MSIRVRFIIVIGILSIVASMALAYASYQFSVKNAMDNAKKQGAVVFNMLDSSRLFFKREQWPLVTELVEDDRFYPQIMSGFVMTRGVWQIFEKRFPGYSFKQASLDPLYPSNKADLDEQKMIEVFNSDKSLKNREGLMEKEGQQYYYFAKPVSVEEKCLRCHGDHEEAPKDQVEIYGTESGYNWPKGQVISTSIVYVPIDKAMAAAKKSATTLFAMGTGGILVLMGFIWIFLSSTVVKPLKELERKATQISLGQELGKDMGVEGNDEIGALTNAIDRLRISTVKLLERCTGRMG